MSYEIDKCSTGLCTTPAPSSCGSTVRHVHEVHTYEVVTKERKKRTPWMQPWSPNCVPYGAGSLVIHCNEYWYNLCKTYSPPGESKDWKVFDPEEFFRWYDANVSDHCQTLALPVYAPEISCSARYEDPVGCGSTNYKLWSKNDVVAGLDGKLYVSLEDNNATYPPSSKWSPGRNLIDLIGELVVKGVAGMSSTLTPGGSGSGFTYLPWTNAQGVNDFIRNWYTGLLGRAPEATEVAWWKGQFMGATTATGRAGVAKAFITAAMDTSDGGLSDATLLAGMTDPRFVAALFNAFLGRTGDAAGIDYWVGDINRDGRVHGYSAFLDSAEFAAHATSAWSLG